MAPKRNRNKKATPKTKKRIIVFSSAENLQLTQAIQANLYPEKYSTLLWSNGFFELSRSYISNFQGIKYDYDFAVVVCSDDDMKTSRGRQQRAIRDNVLLELGMCISTFTLERVIIVKQKDVELPSDLDGVTPIEYSIGKNENINAVAGTICASIETYINREKMSALPYVKLSWDEYFHTMKVLTSQLSQSSSLGGFEYDVIVGINRGGLMAADLIGRENAHNTPIFPLYADRKTGNPSFETTFAASVNEGVISILSRINIKNILLVDSFTRDGKSVIAAKKYLTMKLPDKTIKSVVIYVNERLKDNAGVVNDIDYKGKYLNLDQKRLSLDIE